MASIPNSNPNLNSKRKLSPSEESFHGMRRHQAQQAANLLFGKKAVMKIDMDYDKRIFNIYIWTHLTESPEKNKQRLEDEHKQCKVFFIKPDQLAKK